MATIFAFPKKTNAVKTGVVIELYTDEEITVTLAAVNLFGRETLKITQPSLAKLEAESVEYCLRQASVSDLLSRDARDIACHILANINRIPIRRNSS